MNTTAGPKPEGRSLQLRGIGLLAIILLIALWIRIPTISVGMPFFYHEDEAHHFNRVVEMVKEGRYDPVYFHKPSLHFYFRMPVVALSFLWGVKQGHLRSVQEIETRDPFGLGKYAFAVSHPGVVKWNRALSVLLALATIALTFFITRRLTDSIWPAALAAGLLAVSPDFVAFGPQIGVHIPIGAVIGVDIVMTFMALLTVWLALSWLDTDPRHARRSTLKFCGVALLAGLTVSSKYNALPIMALPLYLAFISWSESGSLGSKRSEGLAPLWYAILLPWVGFLLGSPYILVHLPLFLDHLSHEIWHYGVAGHSGNDGEPGLPQVLHYSRWLMSDGVGALAAIAALIGLVLCLKDTRHRGLVVFIFPLLFAILMCAQKANFTRNMMVALPFVCIAAGYGISRLRNAPRYVSIGAALLILALPIHDSWKVREGALTVEESRRAAMTWLQEQPKEIDRAISGQLQFPSWIYRQPGVVRFSEERLSPLDLYLDGYDQIIVRSDAYRSARGAIVDSLKELPGKSGTQRVVHNPAISILTFRTGPELEASLLQHGTSAESERIDCLVASPQPSCLKVIAPPNPEEPYAWITKRVTRLSFSDYEGVILQAGNPTTAIALSIRTPWPDQELEVITPTARHIFSFSPEQVGEWREIAIPLSSPRDLQAGLILRVRSIHSPKARGIGEDPRRLGLAIRSARLVSSPPSELPSAP